MAKAKPEPVDKPAEDAMRDTTDAQHEQPAPPSDPPPPADSNDEEGDVNDSEDVHGDEGDPDADEDKDTEELDAKIDSHLADTRAPSGVTANPINAQPPSGDDVARRDPDPIIERKAAKWFSPKAMIEDIERHAAKTHGLAADKDLLLDIAAFLRVSFHVPVAVDEPSK